MALRGNLKDFSLPDVFQLVTLSRKTGILRIKRADGAEGSVWFREGDVFFAQSNWHREPLGERLVAASKVTPSGLSRALEVQKAEGAGGRRLGQILVDEGYITDKVLEAFVQEQIQDTIFDLFRWDEGDFDFDPLEGVPAEDIGLSVSIENIVMEGSRRLEEWNRIKKKIPSMEIVFKMATAPGEGTFEISLKPVEWNLLLLVDGTRSVAELATDTSRTDFEVSRVLYGLFSAGLLEVASDEEVEKLRSERRRLEERAAELRAEMAAAAPPVAPPAAPPATPEPVPAAQVGEPAPVAEHEVPTFLTRPADESASVEDMAVFEEMMGAVLQAPPEPAAEPPVSAEPEAAVQPETLVEPELAEPPAPEPPPEVVAEAPSIDIPVTDFDETPTAPVEEFDLSASDFFTAPEEAVPAPPAVEEPAIVEEPPVEEPAEPEPASLDEEPPFVAPAAVEEPPVSPAEDLYEEPVIAEPMSVVDLSPLTASVSVSEETASPVEPEPAFDFLAEPLPEAEIEPEGEIEPEPEPETESVPELESEMTIAEIEAAASTAEDSAVSLEDVLADVPAVEIMPEPLEDEVASETTTWDVGESSEELTELLSSLREEAEATEPVIEETFLSETELDAGDVVELGEPETTGVISTDAFLSDIDEIGGGAFSGGLGDELTALTGGGRARPNVAAPATPASPEHAIHRDHLVDKDLVMKVIDGIKNL